MLNNFREKIGDNINIWLHCLRCLGENGLKTEDLCKTTGEWIGLFNEKVCSMATVS